MKQGKGGKRMKKWLPAALSVTVSISVLLTACSSNDAPSATDAKATATTETSKATEAPKVQATFNVISNDGGYAYSKTATKEDPYHTEMARLFSEFSGQPTTIKYEFIPSADYTQQVTVRFASGDIPEVVTSDSILNSAHATAVENGIFLPLNDLIDKYGKNIKAKVPEATWSLPALSKDGKIYGIPKLLTPINPQALLIRKDWLDKLGMKQPETIEEYLAFFEKVKTTDLNGNGKNDEVGYEIRGMFGFSNFFFYAQGISPGENGTLVWHDVNGQFIPDIINPKMKEAMLFYKMLYDKGYMNKDFINVKDADWVKAIQDDKVATWSHDLRNLNSWTPDKFAGKSAKIDLLPGVKQADGKYILGPKGTGIAKVYILTKNAKNPERFIQFLDWTYSDNAKKDTFFRYGIKDRNYTEANGQITWDPKLPANANEKLQYQTMVNPAGDTRMDPEVIKREGVIDPELVKKGVGFEEKNLFEIPSMSMPTPDSIKTKPELGFAAGSLFLDTLTQIMIGKIDPDKGFDNFVADWKKRGGDQAIKEANEWYAKNKKK
jgi:putative aldouronate transport system substrate-binding protein